MVERTISCPYSAEVQTESDRWGSDEPRVVPAVRVGGRDPPAQGLASGHSLAGRAGCLMSKDGRSKRFRWSA